jgi:phosphomannomutase/phosphoglucomutase
MLAVPQIAATGFREYDARWRWPEEINLPGMQAVGLALGTQLREAGGPAEIVVGCDFREYALPLKQALILGLVAAGARVLDIGLALSPMAYWAGRRHGAAVAMVTASHNPNGWTGLKTGFAMPLTHGPEEMGALAALALGPGGRPAPGGSYRALAGTAEDWLAALAAGRRLARRPRVVVATGNGTAAAFAPAFLSRLGAEVIPRHTDPDWRFPHYNPNPEAPAMLHDMAEAVRESGADLALGFDGDGDRCGVVDDTGADLGSDKMGVLIARDLAARHPGARFIADVKSTGLFATDPVLARLGARTEYWKTGHSHIKRRLAETGALAAFEKSGHYFFAPPEGEGHDCGLTAARAILELLDRAPGRRLSELRASLPPVWTSPTLSPPCPDLEKYAVVGRISDRLHAHAAAGGRLGGVAIAGIVTVNGARVQLADGGFALVRASSNTPNLVVVCESPGGAAALRALFADLDRIVRTEPSVGAYDQTF